MPPTERARAAKAQQRNSEGARAATPRASRPLRAGAARRDGLRATGGEARKVAKLETMASAPAWLEVGRGREEAAAALHEAARGGARAFVLGASDLVSEERGQDAGKDLGGRQGVYTCMRTSCSRMKALRDGAREEEGWPAGPWVASVIKLEMHVKRISSFLPECTPAIALSAVRDILHAFGNVDDEAVLVTLVACPVDAKTSRLFAHAMLAPPLSSSVELISFTNRRTAGGNRQGGVPLAKTISWIRDRAPLEKAEHREGIAEIIMLDKDGDQVLEGLISNVFVVSREGVVWTAPKDVLCGSTRALVINCCLKLDIPLALRAPRLTEVDQWAAVLLTSANKPAVEVRAILLPGESAARPMPGHEVATKLQANVREAF